MVVRINPNEIEKVRHTLRARSPDPSLMIFLKEKTPEALINFSTKLDEEVEGYFREKYGENGKKLRPGVAHSYPWHPADSYVYVYGTHPITLKFMKRLLSRFRQNGIPTEKK